MNRKIEPELLGVAEAAQMTGRSQWTWRRDANERRISSVKLGRRLLIPIAEIRRVIAEGTRPKLCLLIALSLMPLAMRAQVVGSYTQGATTTKVNQTAATAGSKATTTVHLLYVMPGTSYAASCSLVGATGAPYIQSITKFTDHIVVTISNPLDIAVASGASEIDCIVTGASK